MLSFAWEKLRYLAAERGNGDEEDTIRRRHQGGNRDGAVTARNKRQKACSRTPAVHMNSRVHMIKHKSLKEEINMKRKVLVKMMGSALAFAMVFGCAAMTPSMTAHAQEDLWVTPGEGDDDCIDHDGRYPGGDDSGSDSGSGETSEDLGRTEGNQFNSGSGGSGNSGSNDGGSSDSGSNDGGSSSGSSYDSSAGGSYDQASSDNGTFQTSAGMTGITRSGSSVKIAGKETWRQAASAADGTFKVYHMGTEQYTLQLKDADGKAASYKGAGMLQKEDGKWYINIVTSGGIDTTGWTAATVKGTSAYLPGLGVSGVCINDAVVVDAEAVAAVSAE